MSGCREDWEELYAMQAADIEWIIQQETEGGE